MIIEEVERSPVELLHAANAKFVDEEFEEAVSLYSTLLCLTPNDAEALSKRAAAHIKCRNFTDAIADANKAIQINPKLLIAHIRKGVACFELEEHEAALAAFSAAAALDPSNGSAQKWKAKCEAELAEGLAGSAPPATSASAPLSLNPPPAVPRQISGSQGTGSSRAEEESEAALQQRAAGAGAERGGASSGTEAEQAPEATPPKFRHEWYQTPTNIVVSIFAKAVKADQLKVDFGEQFLSVIISDPPAADFALQTRLFAKINPSLSRFLLSPSKVELRLSKASPLHWTSLHFSSQPSVAQPVNISSDDALDLKTRYPSSSRAKKDWNQVEAQVKEEEKEEKLEGDAALNKLFQDIYRGADEDTRRAMNKSFVESGGTVLSTNWKEVGAGKVEHKS